MELIKQPFDSEYKNGTLKTSPQEWVNDFYNRVIDPKVKTYLNSFINARSTYKSYSEHRAEKLIENGGKERAISTLCAQLTEFLVYDCKLSDSIDELIKNGNQNKAKKIITEIFNDLKRGDCPLISSVKIKKKIEDFENEIGRLKSLKKERMDTSDEVYAATLKKQTKHEKQIADIRRSTIDKHYGQRSFDNSFKSSGYTVDLDLQIESNKNEQKNLSNQLKRTLLIEAILKRIGSLSSYEVFDILDNTIVARCNDKDSVFIYFYEVFETQADDISQDSGKLNHERRKKILAENLIRTIKYIEENSGRGMEKLGSTIQHAKLIHNKLMDLLKK